MECCSVYISVRATPHNSRLTLTFIFALKILPRRYPSVAFEEQDERRRRGKTGTFGHIFDQFPLGDQFLRVLQFGLVDLVGKLFAGLDTQIIAASVRNPIHVTDCALAGADIATVPYNVIVQMTKHPLTDAGIEKFQKDYIAVFGE